MSSDWITPWSTAKTVVFIKRVSDLLSRDPGAGPWTAAINAEVQGARWDRVINFPFDYSESQTLRDVQLSRQIHALISKQSEWLSEAIGVDPLSVAFDKFLASEYRCIETNRRLETTRPCGRVSTVLYRAQRKISSILGDLPNLDAFKYSFGPGATTSTRGSLASPRAKLGASLACSEELVPFVGDFLAEVPLWAWSRNGVMSYPTDYLSVDTEDYSFLASIEIHLGKLDFVPKDAKSQRPIVVEPILNGLFQKGVGSYLRDRLLATSGVDLRDQSRNRGLAREGSVSGRLATVDLASASDTISIGLIWDLIPYPWAEFLSKLRTPEVEYGPKRIVLEKFSSMGNGFTFELESILFYSLALGVTQSLGLSEDEVSIFGDDIILPSEAYPLLVEVLDWCGFEVNTKKSFSTGPFRESCGADWFMGSDVRPYYLKDVVSERSLYSFHNWALRNGERDLADFILSNTCPALRLFGPDGYGDGHLVGSFNLRTRRQSRRDKWEGGFFDTYSLRPRRVKKRYDGDWVFPSYSVYTRSGERDRTDPNIVRGSNGYAKMSLYTLATTVFRRN